MAVHTKDMTSGRPVSLILGFALPLMAGNVFQQLYTVVDTAVVGKALGVNALAALGAADWLCWMMLGIIQGISQGFAIRMAKDFGARRYDELRSTVGCSALLSIISAAGLLVLGQCLAAPALGLLQTPGEILPSSLLYLRIIYTGIPIVMLYNLLASVLRALGDGRTPLNAMIVASVSNITLDLLFVLVFNWGIAGAAAATLIAQLISSLFCLWHIRKLELLRLGREHFRLPGRLSARLIALSIPMAVQNGIIGIGGMIIQLVVNGGGILFIAGFTATNKLYGILEIAAGSYGYAMISYCGQNLGAGRFDRIKKGMGSAVIVALATSLVIAAAMVLLGKLILGLFISGTAAQIQGAMAVAYEYLCIMSIFLPVLYLLHVFRSAIQGMGNTVLPMLSGITEFFMRCSMVFVLPGFFGERGIFLAEISAWLGAVVVLIPSYFIISRRLFATGRNRLS